MTRTFNTSLNCSFREHHTHHELYVQIAEIGLQIWVDGHNTEVNCKKTERNQDYMKFVFHGNMTASPAQSSSKNIGGLIEAISLNQLLLGCVTLSGNQVDF